jgi:hypothetical protein
MAETTPRAPIGRDSANDAQNPDGRRAVEPVLSQSAGVGQQGSQGAEGVVRGSWAWLRARWAGGGGHRFLSGVRIMSWDRLAVAIAWWGHRRRTPRGPDRQDTPRRRARRYNALATECHPGKLRRAQCHESSSPCGFARPARSGEDPRSTPNW